MTNIIPTVAVPFAALCVWLIVRIINRRERWAKRALAAMVGAPILYVANFGPWCWFMSRRATEMPFISVPAVFEPLTWCFRTGRLGDALEWYTKVGATNGSFWHADGGLDPLDNSSSFTWCWKCPAEE